MRVMSERADRDSEAVVNRRTSIPLYDTISTRIGATDASPWVERRRGHPCGLVWSHGRESVGGVPSMAPYPQTGVCGSLDLVSHPQTGVCGSYFV